MNIIYVFFILCHANSEVLFEAFRSKPGVREQIVLTQDGDVATLLTTSNFLALKKKEFGKYQRKSTDLQKKMNAILQSQPKLHERVAFSHHDWQLKVMGHPLTHQNPRFDDVFQMLSLELDNNRWNPVKIYTIEENKKAQLIFTTRENQKVIQQKNYSFFEVCDQTYKGSLICEFEAGFIYWD